MAISGKRKGVTCERKGKKEGKNGNGNWELHERQIETKVGGKKKMYCFCERTLKILVPVLKALDTVPG
jgi:hypothetical protein